MREPLKDGEIRPSKNGVAIVVGIWQEGENIKISSEGHFISSISNDENSVRYHRNLYKHLKNILEEQGKWKGE